MTLNNQIMCKTSNRKLLVIFEMGSESLVWRNDKRMKSGGYYRPVRKSDFKGVKDVFMFKMKEDKIPDEKIRFREKPKPEVSGPHVIFQTTMNEIENNLSELGV